MTRLSQPRKSSTDVSSVSGFRATGETPVLLLIFVLLGISNLNAAVGPAAAQKLCDDVTPSLVAVQYTWQSELGRREIIGSGVVIGADGLVAAPLAEFHQAIPDEQMKEFKIIVPKADADEDELDAVFLGRDERSN